MYLFIDKIKHIMPINNQFYLIVLEVFNPIIEALSARSAVEMFMVDFEPS